MKKLILILCLFALPSMAEGLRPPSYIEGAVTIMASELQELRKTEPALVLIDTRNAADYASGHIPGAVNLSTPKVNDMTLSKLAPQSTIPLAFYCQDAHCIRASEAVKQALAAGFGRVYFYYGGLADWQVQNLPVFQPTQ